MSDDQILRVFIGVLTLLVVVAISAGVYGTLHATDDDDCQTTLTPLPSGNGIMLHPNTRCEDN